MPALQEMLNDMNYEAYLHSNSSSPSTAENRFANVLTLLNSIKKSIDRAAAEGAPPDIETAIRNLVLRDLLEEQNEDPTGNRVQLMTLHAAKGLEFPHVIIMGLEENLLPHRNSIDSGNIDEERRLCYVGITRARRVLTLTLAKQRKHYGHKVDCNPSRFLEEIPAGLVVREGYGEQASPEQQKQRSREAMASLKNMFADL